MAQRDAAALAMFEQAFGEVGRVRGFVSAPLVGRHRSSERIPGRLLGEFQVAHIDAQPDADAGPDRNHDNVVGVERGEPEAADEIGRSVKAAKPAVNRADGREIVDQHHSPVAVAAGVESDRRSLPIDWPASGVAGVHFPFAVPQSSHKRRRRLLAENIRVRQTPPTARLLNHVRKSTGNGTKEPMAVVDDLIDGKSLRSAVRGSVRAARAGQDSSAAHDGEADEPAPGQFWSHEPH
jgi:hypothetical protein